MGFFCNESYFSIKIILFYMVERACFGAGGFWSMQLKFDSLKGVLKSKVGFMGGQTDEPTYNDVQLGRTGHAEVVYLEFDPKEVTYSELVDFFFSLHDPSQKMKQGVAIKNQHRSIVFYYSEAQHEIALSKFMELQRGDKYKDDLVTEIIPRMKFWPAEPHHQKYLNKMGLGKSN